jgi:Cof subfamily protein (haloacid dehalogenase superfamily)
MRKLIAIDLDGTLLSPSLEISDENLTAMKLAQDEGHVVMICSGRAPEDISDVLKSTGIKCPIAGSNGTVVIVDGNEISNISMRKKDVIAVAQILNHKRNPYKIYTSEGIYVPSSWSENFAEMLEEHKELAEQLTKRELQSLTEKPKESDTSKIFDSLDDLLSIGNFRVQKFFIPTIISKLKEELIHAFQEIEGISITTSGPYNIEIMDKNGNKSNGLKTVSEFYQIPIENTIAIGDNYNDVPMMGAAGLSIAMGNADPKIKELCDVTTLSNQENGVAVAIKKYMLMN